MSATVPSYRRVLGVITALLTFAVDQGAKLWALAALWPPYQVAIEVLPVWSFRLGFNTGVAFGLLGERAAGAVWALVLLKLVVVGLLLRWLRRAEGRAEVLALGLVVGGALGNVFDRVRLGAVVDFIDWHYRGWHWPTFNMADVAIVCGVGLLLVGSRSPHRAAEGRATR